MVMETRNTTSPSSVVSEFEGTLLKSDESFSYFMLLAFDASGLIRFVVLLFLWPVIKLLNIFGFENATVKLMILVATAGLRERDIESAARAVLPKFYMDDLDMDTWRVFSSCKERVVVTRMPRVMVEWFAKEHLGADHVIGTELIANGLGFVTGLIREADIDQSISKGLSNLFVDRRPHLGVGRPASTTFLLLCEEQIHEPVHWNNRKQQVEVQPPKHVIFHDGSLVKRPTPAMALFIVLWIPFGVILAVIRTLTISILPLWAISYLIGILGIRVIVKDKPRLARNSVGLLFVCNHRTTIDPVLISYVLGVNIPVIVSSNRSQIYRFFSPVPVVQFTRTRDVDAAKMKQELSKGNLVVCPEGTHCKQPFVRRFSSMFAELTDKIVPVAINCRFGLFHSRARSANDLQFFISLFMNPTLVYEVTFLNQLPIEDTCSSGITPYDVANHVQTILADTCGFKCTNLRRKDFHKILNGN